MMVAPPPPQAAAHRDAAATAAVRSCLIAHLAALPFAQGAEWMRARAESLSRYARLRLACLFARYERQSKCPRRGSWVRRQCGRCRRHLARDDWPQGLWRCRDAHPLAPKRFEWWHGPPWAERRMKSHISLLRQPARFPGWRCRSAATAHPKEWPAARLRKDRARASPRA